MAKDAALYRTLRLEALQTYPDYFVTTHAEAAARSAAEYRPFLKGTHTVAAFDAGTPTGTVTLMPEAHPREAHRASIAALYVRPAHQGGPTAAALLAHIKGHARSLNLTQLELRLAATNTRAAAFYIKQGFTEWGRLPNATDQTDDIFMVLPLAKP